MRRRPAGYRHRNVEKLLDRVVCAYQRPELAGSHRMNTLTIWSLIADLGKKELVIRFFLDDGVADPDMPNHLLPKWATYRFGFGSWRSEDATAELPASNPEAAEAVRQHRRAAPGPP